MPANRNNWMINSRCIFECVALGEVEALRFWNALAVREQHTSDSGSRYIIDGDVVYRMSDHWGVIRTCSWGLEAGQEVSPPLNKSGEPLVTLTYHVTNNKLIAIGRARLADFRRNKW